MIDSLAVRSIVPNSSAKAFKRISNYVKKEVIELDPRTTADRDAYFMTGWYCFFGHLTTTLNPELDNEFKNSLLYHPLLESTPKEHRLGKINKVVDAIEEKDEFFDEVTEVAEICAGMFSDNYPDRDLEDLCHIEFDSEAQLISFQVM